MNETIDYYEKNANDFVSSTQRIDFHEIQDYFLSLIPKGGLILDYGCGAGRDTRYFLDKGYDVEAVDGSEEMCKAASEYTGIAVKHMVFEDLDDTEKYDGIWACASILHVPLKQLQGIMGKMTRALKTGGVMYVSFKYGELEGMRNGRYFTDMTEKSLDSLIGSINESAKCGIACIKRSWMTRDVRKERDEKWLNAIVLKQIAGENNK